MGRSHAVSGVLAATVAAVPFTVAADVLVPALAVLTPVLPWPVLLLAVAVTGGAALLPDIDEPQATASRSLGFVTRWTARGVARASLEIYHATRGPGDTPDRRSGHRLVTHTPVGAVTFGLLVTVAVVTHPVTGAVTLGLLCGLLGLGMRQAGFACAAAGTATAWWVTTTYPGWWWLWGAAVTFGAHIHREGDWCTNSGVPRRSWPLLVDGRRWDLHRSPIPFPAGGDEETTYVFPGLCIVTLAAGVTAVGGLPLVVTLFAGVGDIVRELAGGQ